MENNMAVLALTAATIGVLHTAFGPDHYLPFVFMARGGGWSRTKTLCVTLACGIGHVLSSILLGAIGIALGVAVGRLETIESFRSELAAWALIAFGLVYCVWGLRRALRNQPHEHIHGHSDGTVHAHAHVHQQDHVHVHRSEASSGHQAASGQLTPWVLFTIFVFGPCEPLIPLLMYPASQKSAGGVVLVTAVFAIATLATMAVLVAIGLAGVCRLPLGTLERYSHCLAGVAISVCGLAIVLLGL